MLKFAQIDETEKITMKRNRMPVKILFLLQLNGRDARQVKRLIRLIYRPWHLYYVHVDARQNYIFNGTTFSSIW